mmetsp:Transcript_119427/g.211056  ORF Transcript_119427/g.211056 Transcript_119427/m.211056 type:complete len:220 (+) Transcript_119427:108-767(+)
MEDPRWQKALLIAGGSAAAAGLLWYLCRDGGDDESEGLLSATGPLKKPLVYKVTDAEGYAIGIRKGPDTQSERTGMQLPCGQAFEVSEVVQAGGQTYLRLADGRGWAFTHSPRDGRLLAEPIELSMEEVQAAMSQRERMMQEMSMMMANNPELREQMAPHIVSMMQNNPEALQGAFGGDVAAQAVAQNPELQQQLLRDPAAMAQAMQAAMQAQAAAPKP